MQVSWLYTVLYLLTRIYASIYLPYRYYLYYLLLISYAVLCSLLTVRNIQYIYSVRLRCRNSVNQFELIWHGVKLLVQYICRVRYSILHAYVCRVGTTYVCILCTGICIGILQSIVHHSFFWKRDDLPYCTYLPTVLVVGIVVGTVSQCTLQ